MTQKEQDQLIGERLRTLTEKRKSLNCHEEKARKFAEDMEVVAKLLSPYHRGGGYASQDRESRLRLWSGTLEGRLQNKDTHWPEWEEVSQTFREIQHLKKGIERLVKELKPFGVE